MLSRPTCHGSVAGLRRPSTDAGPDVGSGARRPPGFRFFALPCTRFEIDVSLRVSVSRTVTVTASESCVGPGINLAKSLASTGRIDFDYRDSLRLAGCRIPSQPQ